MDRSDRYYLSEVLGAWPPDKNWWNSITRFTSKGINPVFCKGLIPHDIIHFNEINAAIKTIQANPEQGIGSLRIYQNNVQKDDYVKKVVSSKEKMDSDYFNYIKSICNTSEKLGIVINNLQDWNINLTKIMSAFLESMSMHAGIPQGGAELVLFAGDYNATAFGVHRDYQDAWFFHLGPGCKTMHLWSEDIFYKLAGQTEKYSDYQSILEGAVSFILEPGDVLFIPGDWFHIGCLDEYSVSLVLDLYDFPLNVICDNAMNKLATQINFHHLLPYESNITYINPLISRINNASPDLSSEIFSSIDDYWFRIISNGGFIRRYKQLLPELKLSNESNLQICNPFQICWKELPRSFICVYLRGHKIKFKTHPKLSFFFERLNQGHPINLSLIINQLNPWSEEAIVYIFALFLRTGVLEII